MRSEKNAISRGGRIAFVTRLILIIIVLRLRYGVELDATLMPGQLISPPNCGVSWGRGSSRPAYEGQTSLKPKAKISRVW